MKLILLFAFIFSAPAAQAGEASLSGPACVIDGDSIMIGGKRTRTGRCGGGVESRLNGVAAPEWDEECPRSDGGSWPCGRAATEALKSMVKGREVSCQVLERDRHKRAVVVCLAGGRDVGRELVRQGLAAACERYSDRYVNQEAEAKAARRGIWAGGYAKPGYCDKKKSRR